MSKQLEKINKLEEQIRTMEEDLIAIQEEYLENDGVIDKEEKGELDRLFNIIKASTQVLFQRKAELPPEITREDFLAGNYSETNYNPPTGIGLFDVSLNPSTGELLVVTKIKFNFEDGLPADFAGLRRVQTRHFVRLISWSDAEKTSWKNSFMALLEGRWGGKFHFEHPDMPGELVYVRVDIQEANAGWHYQADINKIPDGSFDRSSVQYFPGQDNEIPEVLRANLDSEDLEWRDAGQTEKQKGAVHEYGHMIGLDDEYPVDGSISHAAMVQSALGTVLVEGNTNDIMSAGNTIKKQHYITFLQALKDITNLQKWQFKN